MFPLGSNIAEEMPTTMTPHARTLGTAISRQTEIGNGTKGELREKNIVRSNAASPHAVCEGRRHALLLGTCICGAFVGLVLAAL